MDIKKITEKTTLPIAIVIAAVILGIAFYAVQYSKQQSIEKQQLLELQEKRSLEEAKAEQTKKEYIAKRKSECYTLYEKERDKWNNIEGSEYDEERDVCLIEYKNGEYNEKICDERLAEYEGKLNIRALINECKKTFTKEF